MSELDPVLALELERWRFTGVPRRWQDVVARAGASPPRRFSRRFAIAAAAAAILAAAPAYALATRLHALVAPDGRPPGITLTARFDGGRFTLRALNTVIAVEGPRATTVPRVFRPVDRKGRDERRPRLRWSLDVGPSSTRVLSAELIRGRGRRAGQLLATLCAPCATNASGTIRLRQDPAISIFNATLRLRTDRGVIRRTLLLERHR